MYEFITNIYSQISSRSVWIGQPMPHCSPLTETPP